LTELALLAVPGISPVRQAVHGAAEFSVPHLKPDGSTISSGRSISRAASASTMPCDGGSSMRVERTRALSPLEAIGLHDLHERSLTLARARMASRCSAIYIAAAVIHFR
jgi:hypothetical protein